VPGAILDQLGLTSACHDLLEFGCGYGTFTIPAARQISGTVRALDLESEMLRNTQQLALSHGVDNVELLLRDFVADGSGLADQSVDYAMLFNILHVEEPVALLLEARRNLADNGLLGIVHWNHDEKTPRGPPLRMRPRPEQCRSWAEAAGFLMAGEIVDLPPYHYGLLMRRPG
jgi:cyclopropane fatty-acyl-phospholipid synthase-like methyltransferase